MNVLRGLTHLSASATESRNSSGQTCVFNTSVRVPGGEIGLNATLSAAKRQRKNHKVKPAGL